MKKLLKILFSLYMIFLSFNIYAIQICDYPWKTCSYSVKHKDSNKKNVAIILNIMEMAY